MHHIILSEELHKRMGFPLDRGRRPDLVGGGVVRSIEKSVRKRSIALARAIICALAADRLGLTGADIARKLNPTSSGVSRLVARGQGQPEFRKIEEMLFGE